MLKAAQVFGALLPALPLAVMALLAADARAQVALGREHLISFAYEDVAGFGPWFGFTLTAVPFVLLSALAFFVLKVHNRGYWIILASAFLALTAFYFTYGVRLDAMLLGS